MWESDYGEHKEGRAIMVQNEVERVRQEVDFVWNATAKYLMISFRFLIGSSACSVENGLCGARGKN